MSESEEKNLALWRNVQKTDPTYTKGFNAPGGHSGTAINATYFIREATEQWGPIGLNWGYTVIEERVDNGAPVYDEQMEILGHVMTNTIRLELWVKKSTLDSEYTPETGEDPIARVTHYGHTPYIYYSANSKRWITDQEATKKSLTDALKKCLSMYGFCADIYLGLFDDFSYVELLRKEVEMEKSDDALTTHIKQKQEYKEWFLKNIKLIETAVSKNELEIVYKSAYRKSQRMEDRDGLLKLTRAKDKRMKEIDKDNKEKSSEKASV